MFARFFKTPAKAASVSPYQVNGLDLVLPVDFMGMFDHCRDANNAQSYRIEGRHFEYILQQLPKGGTALDVGASGGLFTAGFSRAVGEFGRVFAFEPGRGMRAFLETNVRENTLTNVTIVPAAVSDQPGKADFHELPVVAGCTWRPEASALKLATPASDAETYSVEVVTLDRYFGDYDRAIHLIKIDIEGFEGNALRGALEILRKHRPFLAIDIHKSLTQEGDTQLEVEQIIKPLGYKVEMLGHVMLCQP